jgi:hypothetical protein
MRDALRAKTSAIRHNCNDAETRQQPAQCCSKKLWVVQACCFLIRASNNMFTAVDTGNWRDGRETQPHWNAVIAAKRTDGRTWQITLDNKI